MPCWACRHHEGALGEVDFCRVCFFLVFVIVIFFVFCFCFVFLVLVFVFVFLLFWGFRFCLWRILEGFALGFHGFGVLVLEDRVP